MLPISVGCSSATKAPGPDGVEAWLVAIAVCFINFIIAGLARSAGIIYVAFMETFHVDRRQASIPISIRSSARNLCGPVVGIFGQKYGVRAVMILGGVIGTLSNASCFFIDDFAWIAVIWGGISGIGAALISTLPQVLIGQHFDKYRTTASGMTFSGGCVGSFLFPALIEYLLFTYGLEGTFLMLSGILMHVIPAAIVLKSPSWWKTKKKQEMQISTISCNTEKNTTCSNNKNECKELKTYDKKNSMRKPDIVETTEGKSNTFFTHIKTAFKLYRKPLFILVCLCRSAHFLTFMPMVTIIVDFAKDKGFLTEDGKYIINVLSFGDLAGRLCLGWITDKGYISLPRYMLFIMILQGIVTISLAFMQSRGAVIGFIALYGLLQGSVFVRQPVLVSRYLESHEQSIAMGCINFFSGLIGLIIPVYIGHFRDVIGSYDGMLYINGSIGAFIGFLWLFEPYFVKLTSKSQQSGSDGFQVSF